MSYRAREVGTGCRIGVEVADSWIEDFNGGIGSVEMVGRTNYIALVGGGKQPKFSQNKVRVADRPWQYVDLREPRSQSGTTRSARSFSLSNFVPPFYESGSRDPTLWLCCKTACTSTNSPPHPRGYHPSRQPTIIMASAVLAPK